MKYLLVFFSMVLGILPHDSLAATAPINIHDHMLSMNTTLWRTSDGWSNGMPFQVAWRADHAAIVSGKLRLRLDDMPCVTNIALCNGEKYAAAEYSSVALLPFGQVDFYAQAAKNNGVITGLFLYTGASDGNPHDEIDIEFLGNNTNQVQLNYFAAGVGGHEKLVALGFDASLAVHHYSIQWDSTMIRWLVDGAEMDKVTVASGAVLPTSNMRIFANIWATVGVDAWAGAFVYPNQPIDAFVDSVDYIESSSTRAITPAAVNASGGCMQAYSQGVVLLFSLLMLALGLRRYRA